MGGGGIARWLMFCFMGAWTGILSVFSVPGAICAAVIAFGYGISEICDAITERR